LLNNTPTFVLIHRMKEDERDIEIHVADSKGTRVLTLPERSLALCEVWRDALRDGSCNSWHARTNATTGASILVQEVKDEVWRIPADAVESICTYLKRCNGKPYSQIPAPLKSRNFREHLRGEPWPADMLEQLCSKRKRSLYHFVGAAYLLRVRCALCLGCAYVASLIWGLPLDQVRTTLDDGEPLLDRSVPAWNNVDHIDHPYPSFASNDEFGSWVWQAQR
jgi:hypothetical protein